MRKEIWNSMLDADMNARYWGELSRTYYSREKWAKIFLAVMASNGSLQTLRLPPGQVHPHLL